MTPPLPSEMAATGKDAPEVVYEDATGVVVSWR